MNGKNEKVKKPVTNFYFFRFYSGIVFYRLFRPEITRYLASICCLDIYKRVNLENRF